MNLRWLTWGVGAAVLYLAAAFLTWRLIPVPVRILYEGYAPLPPYRWVAPPPALAGSNEAPAPAAGAVPLGLRPSTIATADGQAIVVFPEGSIAPRTGESSADVRITPLDAAKVAPPPKGFRFDGNAYRIEALYSASKAPVSLTKPCPVVLRYPIHATELFLLSPSGWTSVRGAQTVSATLQIFATVDQLGTFVAAAAP
jgi:hypothetical protein